MAQSRERIVLYFNMEKKEDKELLRRIKEEADNLAGFLRKAVEFYLDEKERRETIIKEWENLQRSGGSKMAPPASSNDEPRKPIGFHDSPKLALKKRGKGRGMIE